jgi:hypothetical protein
MSMIGRMVMVVGIVAVLLAAGVARGEDVLPEPPLYGLYTWAGNYVKYADDIEKVGITSVRCGGWGQKDVADKAALIAAKKGVIISPSLGLGGLSHSRTMPVEEALAKYREVAREAVRRYGPGGTLWKENPDVKPMPIRYWQIWNEPNIEFLNPGESGLLRTQLYAKLLKAAGEEIRKLDPGAKIVAFNTAGGCQYLGSGVPPDGMWQKLKYIGWRKFIRDVTDLVGPKSYDIIGTHPYTKPKPPEGRVDKGIEMLGELFKEKKFTKPIWFTEVGFPLEYPRNQQVRDERQQACFTTRLYAISAAHGVKTVQIMYVTDIIYGPDKSRRSFGFFTAPGQWREQAKATRVMARLIPDPRKNVKIISEGTGDVWVYQFEGPSRRPVIMAWYTGEGTKEHKIKTPGEAALQVDMLGKAGVVNPDGKVTLSEAPIYIIVTKPRARLKTIENLLKP